MRFYRCLNFAWNLIYSGTPDTVRAGRVFAKGFPFQARPVVRGDAAIVSRRGERSGARELRSEIWVDAAVTGRYWGKAIRAILEDKDCGRVIVYAPWAMRGNRVEQAAGRRVYIGFQAELVNGKDAGEESIIVFHPTVWPPAMEGRARAPGAPQAVGGEHGGLGETALPSDACNVTVCLPAFDASPYNLPWRRWAAESGAKVVFSLQCGARIDSDQNREFWRELLFNEYLNPAFDSGRVGRGCKCCEQHCIPHPSSNRTGGSTASGFPRTFFRSAFGFPSLVHTSATGRIALPVVRH